MLEITLEPRSCECCGSNDLEDVWQSQSIVARSKNTWRFPNCVAICRSCGFCFASPAPRSTDLAQYHSEGLTGYKDIELPYSIDTRMAVLDRYSAPEGVFVEIGGDGSGEFHGQCASLFRKQYVVEIAEDTPAEFRSVHALSENSVDVLAHYDVIEHVAEAKSFLAACHRAIRPDGVMICEVPDIRLYPKNLLLLEFEHVNHFSITTLNALARQVGLNLIEVEHVCSRPYGLLAIFRKEPVLSSSAYDGRGEYLDSLACIQGGLEQIRRLESQIMTVRQRVTDMTKKGKKVTLWAATDILRRFLNNFSLPPTVIVVDSDPRRRNDLADDAIVVEQPKDSIRHIADSELLVICASRYQANILEWVRNETGKTFSGVNLAILGGGAFGETLT